MGEIIPYRRVLLVILTVLTAALIFSVDGPALWDSAVEDATILDARLSGIFIIFVAAFLASGNPPVRNAGLSIYILAYLSVGLLGSYQLLMRIWTCRADGLHYVVGNTPNFGARCAVEISNAGHATNEIWNPDALVSRFLELQLVLSCAAFVASILAFFLVDGALSRFGREHAGKPIC
jgi:hypothetical protein